MPRGIPKSGKRAEGAGRKRKYGDEASAVMRVPVSLVNKMEELSLFLLELETEIEFWEEEVKARELRTNPRWSKAAELAASIRERIDALKE